MKAVGGIDALKKLTQREWLWCLDSAIKEYAEERGLQFQAPENQAKPSPTDGLAVQTDTKTIVDNDFEKHLAELKAQSEAEG